MKVTYIDLAYAAAFVEADGCIQLTGVRVTNRCLKVLSWFEETFGGQVRPKGTPQDCWEWNIHAADAETFLNEIYDYLKFKGPQADLFFEYRTTVQKRGVPISPSIVTRRQSLSNKLSFEKSQYRSKK